MYMHQSPANHYQHRVQQLNQTLQAFPSPSPHYHQQHTIATQSHRSVSVPPQSSPFFYQDNQSLHQQYPRQNPHSQSAYPKQSYSHELVSVSSPPQPSTGLVVSPPTISSPSPYPVQQLLGGQHSRQLLTTSGSVVGGAGNGLIPLPISEDSLDQYEVFVGNLSQFCEGEDLMQFFSQYVDTFHARVVKADDNKRSLMYGFVTLTSPSMVQKAIAVINGQLFMGRRIKIEPSDRDKPIVRNDSFDGYPVHMSLTSPYCPAEVKRFWPPVPQEQLIREAFEHYGPIIDVQINMFVHNHRSSRYEGFGFITFATPHPAEVLVHRKAFALGDITVTIKQTQRGRPRPMPFNPSQSRIFAAQHVLAQRHAQTAALHSLSPVDPYAIDRERDRLLHNSHSQWQYNTNMTMTNMGNSNSNGNSVMTHIHHNHNNSNTNNTNSSNTNNSMGNNNYTNNSNTSYDNNMFDNNQGQYITNTTNNTISSSNMSMSMSQQQLTYYNTNNTNTNSDSYYDSYNINNINNNTSIDYVTTTTVNNRMDTRTEWDTALSLDSFSLSLTHSVPPAPGLSVPTMDRERESFFGVSIPSDATALEDDTAPVTASDTFTDDEGLCRALESVAI